ncbi:NFX1-type zinc finger-containing protein 1-like [Daphnia carinata]|uniref:NFX1-type zinc finger-containing protein 1-like n=1 Tax=Daphnia carinata TaxID=120202 RepID=UPI0025805E17|nr:NFX1-type zinc finger-containing protein 1-like [Daphnia carinata]
MLSLEEEDRIFQVHTQNLASNKHHTSRTSALKQLKPENALSTTAKHSGSTRSSSSCISAVPKKPNKKNEISNIPVHKSTQGSYFPIHTSNVGCRPKSGNWRQPSCNLESACGGPPARPVQKSQQFLQRDDKISSSQHKLFTQDTDNGNDEKDGRENSKKPHNKQPFKHHPLSFSVVLKMMVEDTEPHIIAQKFDNETAGLRQFLDSNAANWEVIELVISVIGNFCQKKGVAKFHNAFIKIVQILANKEVFANLGSTVLHITKARSTNLGSKEVRMSRLIRSISYLTTEMLTVMPALTCDYLGEKFFEDLTALKNIPSIKATNVGEDFDFLQKEGADRLKNAWEQHSKEKLPQGNRQQASRMQRQELLSLLKPPDDFRQLSVLPEWDDVCNNVQPFLRPNIIKGSYPDVDTYLDIQFRLLREDFLNPLREGLVAFRTKIGKQQKQQIRVDNIRLYYNVQIKDDGVLPNDIYVLEFSTKGFERVNWEGSKRLLFGSLLLLSADNFDSFMLFTVVDRKPDQLSRGRFRAKFEGQILPSYAKKTDMVMAESSVFFEAYRSVLIALQRISPAHFPMEDYILCRNTAPAEPEYLRSIPNPVYDLTPVRKSFLVSDPQSEEEENASFQNENQLPPMVQRLLMHVPIFEEHRLPDADTLGLDPSQAEALYAALTRKLTVIQGPPGTGKTYLGLKIVQTLLRNKQYWVGLEKPQPTPILVICYTNHALDQFLEGIMKFTQKIVRIGGQSKCAALSSFSLREWRQRATILRKRPGQYRHWLYEARNKLNETKSALEKHQRTQRMIESYGIVHNDILLNSGILTKPVYRTLCLLKMPSDRLTVIPYWLGIESIQTLRDIVWALRNRSPKPQLPSAKATSEPVVDQDEPGNEEEWDKEDLEEIEGQRILDDGEYLSKPANLKKEKEWTTGNAMEIDEVTFVVSIAKMDQEINSLETLLDQLQGEDVQTALSKIAQIQQQREYLREILEILPAVDAEEYQRLIESNIIQLPYLDRWRIYSFWRAKASELWTAQINSLNLQVQQQTNELKDVETIETAEIIREAHVVGITTTGAAKNRALLEHLKSKIVVVEEAAEVLEAHIVTSMSSSCEHLILIGDHQQLRPPTTVYTLAKDYHLDVSLFERLIKNGVDASVLGVQHRMRTDVAKLIVPAIYPHLKNHPSVLSYTNVPGMAENVFFLAHSEREKGDKSDQESRSHLNPYEANMALALARHLLIQGLEPSKITILTTYSGQLLHFKKLRRSHAILQGVRITIVDNFQGEENDVIILSLVRSNEEANVGFLKIENRVCVALSRAKKGFYLIGNMGNLAAKSELWRQVKNVLASSGQIGPHFDLRCEVHKTIIKANDASHFPPEGGCFVKCVTEMPCGHICPKICHAEDREHIRQKCHGACLRFCAVGHKCPKICYQDCNPCMTTIPKVLPCNHSQITECHRDPANEYCLTKVVKAFPTCQHTIELNCGTPISEVKCPELCGMRLDCEHICNRICHKRSSHAKMPCDQPCHRFTCPEKHPCPKKCFEECGKCVVDVVKKLPCGHDGTIKCWMLPKDAYCNIKVERILSNCQHTAFFDCSESTKDYKCKRPCGKLTCNDGHICHKPCYEPCGPCNVQVQRKLNCGHTTQTACYKDPLTIKCKFPKDVTLPDCGHRVEIPCSEPPEKVVCPKPCDTRLDCGHQCTELCHVKKDPTHQKYICKKACSQKKVDCRENHKCGKKCFEDCDLCLVKVNRTLPCGHSQIAECFLSDEKIKCTEIVNKTIIECMHSIRIECSVIATRRLCKQPCEKYLKCGHQCKKQCRETCTSLTCQEPVEIRMLSPCGHPFVKSCSDYQTSHIVTDSQAVEFLQTCPQPCRATLTCDHPCKGSCGMCFNGRLHKTCAEKCGRTLVCGHSCNVDCAVSCPPCKQTCEYRCQHSRCRKICCEPCVDCVEPCDWKCDHYTCTLKCHELCNRPRCDEPCRKRLPCGHRCIGLCGEVCPPLCRACHKDQLTEFILYGNEEEEDARFIYLEDCNHTIEVEGLDHWMEMKQEETQEIQTKCCPRCKTIIRSCYRYNNVIKRNFGDILEVKRMLLRSRVSAKDFTEKLLKKVEQSHSQNNALATKLSHGITNILAYGLDVIRNAIIPTVVQDKRQYKTLDTDTRYMTEVQVDVIERVLSFLANAPRSASSLTGPVVSMNRPLLENLLSRVEQLLLSLFPRERLNVKEHEWFIAEVNRLDLVRAFFLLKSASSINNRHVLVAEETRQVEDLLMRNVKTLTTSYITIIKEILGKMGKKLNTGLGISDVERQQIVKAMGLAQGHWYKCPNGHIYVITECGGAMQQAKCNECGASIGGGSHRLLSDNRLAGEMDGARHAAWSEHANNMANFQIDD